MPPNDQIEVSDPSQAPWPSVCRLLVTRKRAGRTTRPFSSGVLVGDRFILTSAHNLFSQWPSTVQRIEASFGYRSGSAVWNAPAVTRIDRTRVGGGYWWKRFRHDYGLVALAAPAPFASSFDLPGDDSPALKADDPVTLGGYPGGRIADGQRPYEGVGKITAVNGRFIHYDVKTATGNSGGPLWVTEKGSGRRIVVGVHVSPGRARRLSGTALAEIRRWMTELT